MILLPPGSVRHLTDFSCFAYDLIRGFGGADQWGVSVYAMSICAIGPYIFGVVAMIAVNTTWLSFSAAALLSRPAITGNTAIFLGIAVPFIITSLVLVFCAGISYEAYLICYRLILVTWGILLFALVVSSSVTGYRNVSRLKGIGDKSNRNQLIRAHAALAILLGIATLIIIFHITWFPQIDSSPIWYLFVYSCYRAVYFLIFLGAACYAWYGAVLYRKSASSKSSTRMSHLRRSEISGSKDIDHKAISYHSSVQSIRENDHEATTKANESHSSSDGINDVELGNKTLPLPAPEEKEQETNQKQPRRKKKKVKVHTAAYSKGKDADTNAGDGAQ